jgi:hypothetical protein
MGQTLLCVVAYRPSPNSKNNNIFLFYINIYDVNIQQKSVSGVPPPAMTKYHMRPHDTRYLT